MAVAGGAETVVKIVVLAIGFDIQRLVVAEDDAEDAATQQSERRNDLFVKIVRSKSFGKN